MHVLFTIQPQITTDLLNEMLHSYMCFLEFTNATEGDSIAIQRCQSRGQHLCRFFGAKESVYKGKSSTPTGLVWKTNVAAILL